MSEPKPDPVSLLKSLSPETQSELVEFILANCRYDRDASREEAEYLGSLDRLHRKSPGGTHRH